MRYPAGPGRFLALGSGDVFLLLACGIVAHSSPRARKWSFDHVPAALWPGPTRSEVDVRLPVALPPGDDATELVLGGAGDVWVQLKSGRLLRDREVHAPVVCELGARPGSRLREVAP
jgi:hypothetical protein